MYASSVKLIATYGVDVIIVVMPAVIDAAIVNADTTRILPYAVVVVAIPVSAACIISSECRAVAIMPLTEDVIIVERYADIFIGVGACAQG
jgi:hypothetical protein